VILPTPLSYYNTKESLRLVELLKEYRNSNCFNPSLIFFGDMIIISFRAYQPIKRKPFHSYLLLFNKIDNSTKVINLSNHYSYYGIDNVADPKLTILNEQVWLTFNTGYSQKPNRLYLAQVFPEVHPPYLCQYISHRRIEKNWSFFIEDSTLKALYSIFPLSILIATRKDESKKIIHFDSQFTDNPDTIFNSLRYMSIGTQAILRNNQLYFIAHKKIYFLGRRIYLGVPLRIMKMNDRYVQIISNKRFIHSYWSLLGSLKKHNPKLWSCTYFSGLQIKLDNKVILAYGINDRKYAFKELHFNKLWESDQ
jgi:hypothetical protein